MDEILNSMNEISLTMWENMIEILLIWQIASCLPKVRGP